MVVVGAKFSLGFRSNVLSVDVIWVEGGETRRIRSEGIKRWIGIVWIHVGDVFFIDGVLIQLSKGLPMRSLVWIELRGLEEVIIDAMKLGANEAGVEVENEADGRSMVGRLAEEDANSRSRVPLGDRAALKLVRQYIDWTAEGMKVSRIRKNVGRGELGHGGQVFISTR